ncbi:TonB-dependent receptor plug domain-containing protein [Roseateles saccharophilus]|uniref:Iron complex outermembrane receptor protein n=1 Tax=Roseateles saccharophilus TaxID=304 RepID=A0A4V2VSW1_ROSSA|nr:TonB-dependent receptor [Roseateles saccharophilus]TCV03760.1 iron complex outermembrane receptor protein [Roseateles saccharophilus]
MRFVFRSVSLAGACWMAAQSAAYAQAPNDEDELAQVYADKTTISIATGRPQALRRAPAVATVITAQDIATMGANDLDEVLETVPGLHVSRSNGAYSPQYLIRGVASDFNPQVLMLQNGVPMTTLYVGSRGIIWGGLPVQNIARIEVIRGPGSALYGADAYAGIINIITKGVQDTPGTELGLHAGSFRTRDAWLQHGGKAGPLDLAAFLRVGRGDGFKEVVASDAQTGLDTVFGTHASLAPGPVNTGYHAIDGGLELGYAKWRLHAGYKQRSDVGTGAGIAGALDPVGRMGSTRAELDTGVNDVDLSPGWRLSLGGSYLNYIQKLSVPVQLFPPGAFGGSFPNGVFGSPNTWERQLRLSAAATYGGWAGHQWRIGLGHDDLDLYRTQEFKNFTVITSGPLTGVPVPVPGGQLVEAPVEDSFLAPHRRRVDYAYVQDEWSFAQDWTLTAGVRQDRYSDFGRTTNPRAALVWDASLDLTAKLLYGSAFRAPSFNEQYGVNPVASGNPTIQPETMRTLEAVLQWHAGRELQLNFNVFRYAMEDIIKTTPNPAPAPGATFRNEGTQHGRGAEIEWVWDPRVDLRFSGSYAYQRSTNELNRVDAGYAPHQHLNARLDWSFAGGSTLSGTLNRVTKRMRAFGDMRPPVPDYTTLDLTLRTALAHSGWDLSFSLLNAFDADVREPSLPSAGIANDLPMARRSLSAQASYRF